MNKELILVVEDDRSIRNLITTTLAVYEYPFIAAAEGKEALMQAVSHRPELVLLDLGLPDMDGVEVIRKIRSWSDMPIIVISARADDSDKIEALDCGADDYLTKPFSIDELLARIRVMKRQLSLRTPQRMDAVFRNGDLSIDYDTGCVYLKKEEIHLTPIEYKLLCVMAKNIGKVLTRTYITNEIWGSSWDSDIASLRVYMNSLRKKIEPSKDSQAYIQTHIGVGYRMIKLQ